MGFKRCILTRTYLQDLLRLRSKAQRNGRLHTSTSARDPQAKPVNDDEFRQLFVQSGVCGVLGQTIGVAFSGGPDSTSLLFLLQRMAMNEERTTYKKLLAIHVDHGLQLHSGQVSEHCASLANALGVKYLAVKIPWGTHPFPPLPAPGEPFENIARDARYHIFMTIMREHNINALAFGHHCDDQVETAILRLSKGSSVFGLAGMRPLRRWGMGFGNGPSSLGWAGYEGMRRWILRPLLSVPKERLLETCEANGLNYVLDPTNLEPAITERNSIRHDLKMLDMDELEGPRSLSVMTKLLSTARTHCKLEAKDLQHLSSFDLRLAVSLLSSWAAEIDKKATPALKACTLPTAQSTILLSSEALCVINDNAVRVAMVRRILRFISPRPWGSPAAEAGGRQKSLQTIVAKIWDISTTLPSGVVREAFVVGAGVQWTPVTILPSGDVRLRNAFAGEKEGWLVHRQPPLSKRKDSSGAGPEQDPLNLKITDIFCDALREGIEANFLYDNRFTIHIDPSQLHLDDLEVFQNPHSGFRPGVEVCIVPHSRYYLPKIILCGRDQSDGDSIAPREIGRLSLRGRVESPSRSNNKTELTPVPPDAIRVEYARMDDAFDDIPALSHSDGPSVSLD